MYHIYHQIDLSDRKKDPNAGPRYDLYRDLFRMVNEWILVPINPNRVYDYQAEKELEKIDDDRIHTSVYEPSSPESRSTMSYQQRLNETLKIVQLLGGQEKALEGCLGFKLTEDVSPLDLTKIIWNNDLGYCAIFSLISVRSIESGEMCTF